ncbi:MAG: RDD family protein [Candidatus Blackburnbacteria bacterium]|nr:RDD family protein [Candidatus Blackburnbacteria bacterium]
MKYVGFGRRFVAWILDAIILGVVGWIVGLLLGGVLGFQNTATTLVSIGNLISLVIWIGYAVFYQASVGQTLGKKVMGIKVVDAQGKTPNMLTFFLREIVGKMVSGIILGIGYLMVLWDSRKQALHDKIASTYVVKA